MKRVMAKRDERGETLVETLITVAILGMAVVGIIGGLVMVMRASDQHHEAADGNVVLTGAAESVVDNNRNPYQICASTATYNPTAGVATPAGWPPLRTAVAITEVDFVNPMTGTVLAASPCPETTPPSGIPVHVAQQITIRVTDPNGRTQQVTVGKSG
jgi:type II secretory pathway pseudopilin PulG